jgi:hypothetical protein
MKEQPMRIKPGIIILLITLAVPLAGCFGTAQNQPTPDLTLTALFAPTGQVSFPSTWTPQGGTPQAPVATATVTMVPSTATPTITLTPLPPTITSTSLPGRPGPYAYAYWQSTPPTLDGDWGEWVNKTVQYPIKSIVYGAKNWSGEADLEASYILGWDTTNLYVSVKVHDEKYIQNNNGYDIYLGDSVELLIDSNLYGDWYTASLNTDDFQVGISPGNPTVNNRPESFLWFPGKLQGPFFDPTIGTTGGDELYRVEFKIPWSSFGIKPYSGLAIGFAISVTDNDDTHTNSTESMASNDPYRHLTNPTTWGVMILY